MPHLWVWNNSISPFTQRKILSDFAALSVGMFQPYAVNKAYGASSALLLSALVHNLILERVIPLFRNTRRWGWSCSHGDVLSPGISLLDSGPLKARCSLNKTWPVSPWEGYPWYLNAVLLLSLASMLRKSASRCNDQGVEIRAKTICTVKVLVCCKAISMQKFPARGGELSVPILLSFNSQMCYVTLIYLLHHNVTSNE